MSDFFQKLSRRDNGLYQAVDIIHFEIPAGTNLAIDRLVRSTPKETLEAEFNSKFFQLAYKLIELKGI